MDRCGNYYLEDQERLGRGGFGEVFAVKVYDLTKTHSKIFARKYFSPSPENDGSTIKAIADLRQRFLVEIKTQCDLNKINYDSIAPIVLFDSNGDKPYFVMEKAECNLFEAIKHGMDAHERKKAVIQILNGLKTIHDNRYIHRDLKTRNILKYDNGVYKITDFGLVKDMDLVRAEIKTKFEPNGIGTDEYRAPEISESGLFSVQSDVYAIGKIINDIYVSNTPIKLRKVIKTCREHWPEDRYKSVQELIFDFNFAMEEE
ncbi:protein kinase domain-containing protein [Enterobacter asburiae]|jgi:serine/threonine-protein kinase|uniref:protein kinase domain-containing protein n=1 Tax=Enterobacter asburiae TaxID=61645 RepID=UPI002B745E91|nr:protein kinase [Enterobacter asburiae]